MTAYPPAVRPFNPDRCPHIETYAANTHYPEGSWTSQCHKEPGHPGRHRHEGFLGYVPDTPPLAQEHDQ